MSQAPRFTTLTSHCTVLPLSDIDTDQIIPARFLKVTNKQGLAEKLFHDWRYLPDGSEDPSFVLNQPASAGSQILVAGPNFGCGSSREHAPWALVAWGFRAVVSTYFADIFSGNALKNGLLPVTLPPDAHAALLCIEAALPVTIDLALQVIGWPGHAPVEFPIDPFAKKCLLHGMDELSYLLSFRQEVEAYEARLRK